MSHHLGYWKSYLSLICALYYLGSCTQYTIEPPVDRLLINMNISGYQRIYCHASDNSIPRWHINGTFYRDNIGLPAIVQTSSYEHRFSPGGQQQYVYLDFSNAQDTSKKIDLKCGGYSGTEWSNNITLVWLNNVPHFFACDLTVVDRMVSWDHCVNPLDYISSYKLEIMDTGVLRTHNINDTQFLIPAQDCKSSCLINIYPTNIVGEGAMKTVFFTSSSEVSSAAEIAIQMTIIRTTFVKPTLSTLSNTSPLYSSAGIGANQDQITAVVASAISAFIIVVIIIIIIIIVAILIKLKTSRSTKEIQSDGSSNSSSTPSDEQVEANAKSPEEGTECTQYDRNEMQE